MEKKRKGDIFEELMRSDWTYLDWMFAIGPNHWERSRYRNHLYTIALKIAERNFLQRYTAFFNRIPIESLSFCSSSAMHLCKKFLAAIFSAILFKTKIIRISSCEFFGTIHSFFQLV